MAGAMYSMWVLMTLSGSMFASYTVATLTWCSKHLGLVLLTEYLAAKGSLRVVEWWMRGPLSIPGARC